MLKLPGMGLQALQLTVLLLVTFGTKESTRDTLHYISLLHPGYGYVYVALRNSRVLTGVY